MISPSGKVDEYLFVLIQQKTIRNPPKTTMLNVIFTAAERILAKQEVNGGFVGGLAFRGITSVFNHQVKLNPISVLNTAGLIQACFIMDYDFAVLFGRAKAIAFQFL